MRRYWLASRDRAVYLTLTLLLPFSYKRRHFCPSYQQKRVIEYGNWLHIIQKFQVKERREICQIEFLYADRDMMGEDKVEKCPLFAEKVRTVRIIQDEAVIVVLQPGFQDLVLFQAFEVFQKGQPGGLLRVGESGGAPASFHSTSSIFLKVCSNMPPQFIEGFPKNRTIC